MIDVSFIKQKEILKLQKEIEELKHNFKMIELDFERATYKLTHDQILERGRINRAEQRKLLSEKRAFG